MYSDGDTGGRISIKDVSFELVTAGAAQVVAVHSIGNESVVIEDSNFVVSSSTTHDGGRYFPSGDGLDFMDETAILLHAGPRVDLCVTDSRFVSSSEGGAISTDGTRTAISCYGAAIRNSTFEGYASHVKVRS